MSYGYGKSVREARVKAGFTLREFAKLLGVSAPFYCDVEHGRRGAWKIEEIARLLNLDATKLRRQSDRYTREEVAWLNQRPELMDMLRRTRGREAGPPKKRAATRGKR